MKVTTDIIVTLRVTGTVEQVAPNSPYVRTLADAQVGNIPLSLFDHEIQRIALDELERAGRGMLATTKPF